MTLQRRIDLKTEKVNNLVNTIREEEQRLMQLKNELNQAFGALNELKDMQEQDQEEPDGEAEEPAP